MIKINLKKIDLGKIKISDKAKSIIKFICIMIVLTLFTCLPYLEEGTIFAHDLTYHLNRILGTSNEIGYGTFPVMIHSESLDSFGYGNPIFYPELFLYPAVVLVKLGFGLLFTYRMLIILITFATFLVSYFSANVISKNSKISYLVSMFYTMSLYRLVDVFVRGALGEVIAFIFLPLVLAGFYNVVFDDNKKWYLICLGLFGIVNSHILSFVITVILLVILCLVNICKIIKDKKKIITLSIAAGVSILLICSFVMPYLEQTMNHDFNVSVHKNSGESLKENAASLKELVSNELVSNGITVSKGLGISLLVLPICIFMIKDKDKRKEFPFYITIYVIGMVFVYISSKLFPWEDMEIFGIIQFPYRLNMISTLLLSFVAAYSVYETFDKKDDIFKLVILFIVVITIGYLSSINVNPNGIDYEILMSGYEIGNGEYIPVGFSPDDKDVYNIYEFDNKIDYIKEGNMLKFEYSKNENEFKVHVPICYYKGYKAYLLNEEGKVKEEIEVRRNELNSHLLLISDNKDIEGTVIVKYEMTTIQKIGYIISIMTFVILVNYIIYVERIKEKE